LLLFKIFSIIPTVANKHLNPQRKVLSADSTGLLNAMLLKVNVSLRMVIYRWNV